MVKYITTFLALNICYCVAAQHIRIEAGAGYGQYSMSGLKELNSVYLSVLPVRAKITDNFPVRPYLSGAIIYYAPKVFYFGPTAGFASTGSRISYEDFSGGLVLDNILTSLYGGIRLGFILSDGKVKLLQENNMVYAFSRLKMYEKILTQEDAKRFKSMSPQFEPGFRVTYNMQRFEFGIKAGYLVDFGGKYKLEGDKSQILATGNNRKPVTSNWSGFRVAASLGFTAWQKKE